MSWYSLSVKPIDEYTSAVIAGIFRSISATLLVLLSLAGCNSGFHWEGQWRGNRNLPVKPGENAALLHTAGDVKLIIESGGQFKMTEMGIPLTGSIRYDGDKAFLKIETRFDRRMDREPKEVQDANKEIELVPQKDGSISFRDPGSFFPEPLTLRREAEASSGGS